MSDPYKQSFHINANTALPAEKMSYLSDSNYYWLRIDYATCYVAFWCRITRLHNAQALVCSGVFNKKRAAFRGKRDIDDKPKQLDQARQQICLKHYSIGMSHVECEWLLLAVYCQSRQNVAPQQKHPRQPNNPKH
jgi:hypothetical protein